MTVGCCWLATHLTLTNMANQPRSNKHPAVAVRSDSFAGQPITTSSVKRTRPEKIGACITPTQSLLLLLIYTVLRRKERSESTTICSKCSPAQFDESQTWYLRIWLQRQLKLFDELCGWKIEIIVPQLLATAECKPARQTMSYDFTFDHKLV